jgi:hypothetical protein
MQMRGLSQAIEGNAAPVLVTSIVAIAATVALCLGHLSEATYVALLAGGVIGAPAAGKAAEQAKGKP